MFAAAFTTFAAWTMGCATDEALGPGPTGSAPSEPSTPGAEGGVPPGSANDAASSLPDAGQDAKSSGWEYAKIGGGGFVTGGTVAADGTKVFRTDTSGAYLYDDATGHFQQIVPRNLPAAANDYWNGSGVYEAMIASSNSSILYVAYNNAVYRSSDRGASFNSVKADFTFDSNGGGMRTLERHGQIDPQNPDHVLFGDQIALYRTIDGGATWTKAAGVSAAAPFGNDTAGFSGVAFNPKSPLVSGRSSEAIASTGGRFFRTTDGGETWTDISSGGPSNGEPQMAEFDAQGRYFAALTPHGVWRYASGTWKDLDPSDQGDTTLFFDPDNADHVYVNNGFVVGFNQSTNAGDTWAGVNWMGPSQTSVDGIPWHATRPHYYPANVLLDPARKTVWMPGGNQGVASIPLSRLNGSPYAADMHGIGIENLCVNVMVAPRGSSKLHAAVWDESYAELDRSNATYPSNINDVGGLAPSWGLDVSKENPKVLARWLLGKVEQSGWTDDGGQTWHPFAKLPADVTDPTNWGYGGTVAYSGVDNIIVVSSNTNGSSGTLRVPYYTLDRGASWHPVTLPTPWTQATVAGVHMAYYLNREILVADPSKLGRFYFLVYADDASFRGVYRTDDGGVTWTRTFAALPGTQNAATWAWNAHLESPMTNHLWMSAGEESPSGQMGNGQLFRSTDGGATFEPMPDVNEPAKFGFGAPAHPGGYPVLFMEGYYKGQAGVWMTADADAPSPRWIPLGPPNGQFVRPNYIAGDPDVPGRVWVATGCDGVQLGNFADLLK
jgi:photosystem II stability/assembly factor-like uncharacterized protein